MMRNLLEFVAVFCGGGYGSFECAEFIIDFLQFLFHIAFGNLCLRPPETRVYCCGLRMCELL